MQEQEPFKILYRDDHCIAIAKRPGIHVHHSALSPHEISCMPILRDQIGTYVYPIHRIDRATSGIVLFALSPEVLSSFNAMMWAGGMRKTYHAIVRGWMDDVICNSPIAIDEKVYEAETHFRSIKRAEMEYPSQQFSTTRISFVEGELITGRRHQIRKHCAHLRHPIAGDVRYGDGKFNMLFRAQYAIHRLLLFATSLQFIHPITQQEITIKYDPRQEDAALDVFCDYHGFSF